MSGFAVLIENQDGDDVVVIGFRTRPQARAWATLNVPAARRWWLTRVADKAEITRKG